MLCSVLVPVIFAILLAAVIKFKLLGTKFSICAPIVFESHLEQFLHPPLKNYEINWRKGATRFNDMLNEYADKSTDAVVPVRPPNIVFILADDLGINDISGGCGIATPNIDSIRQNGVSFTNAYAGQATCAPSRAAIFTGRFASRFGFEFTPVPKELSRVLTTPKPDDLIHPILHEHLLKFLPDMRDMVMPVNETMFSQVLQRGGYDTYFLGKWDDGDHSPYTPTERGYNESLSFALGASLYKPVFDSSVEHMHGLLFDDFLRFILPFYVSHNNGPKLEPDSYMTDFLADQAARLIRSRTPAGMLGGEAETDPFLITLAFNAPHNPFQALKSDFLSPDVQALPTRIEQIYAGMIKALDRGVGKVLQALRETNQLENTLVIFTSDNGGANYAQLPNVNAPFRGWKATLFEGGLRVPLFMQWPNGIYTPYATKTSPAEPGESTYLAVHDVVAHVDLFPTLASFAAKRYNSSVHLDGANILSLIKHDRPSSELRKKEEDKEDQQQQQQQGETPDSVKQKLHDRTLFWRSGHYKAVRKGDWKLQVSLHPNKIWFFNLKDDPTEEFNLAAKIGITTERSLQQAVHNNLKFISSPQFLNCSGEVDPMSCPEPSSNGLLSISEETINFVLHNLLRLYISLVDVDAQQREPIWASVSETPVPIDKVQGAMQMPGDEYIYWSN
jgi:arylsulfatase A-like enzyme